MARRATDHPAVAHAAASELDKSDRDPRPMSPTAKEMATDERIGGRDANLVKTAPELFDLLVEIVELYEFGAVNPDVIIRAKTALRKAMGGS